MIPSESSFLLCHDNLYFVVDAIVKSEVCTCCSDHFCFVFLLASPK